MQIPNGKGLKATSQSISSHSGCWRRSVARRASAGSLKAVLKVVWNAGTWIGATSAVTGERESSTTGRRGFTTTSSCSSGGRGGETLQLWFGRQLQWWLL